MITVYAARKLVTIDRPNINFKSKYPVWVGAGEFISFSRKQNNVMSYRQRIVLK